MSADWLEQNYKCIYLFFKKLWGKIFSCHPLAFVLRHELSSWTLDDDWGKLGHQSSASTQLLNHSYHLSANTISWLPCCIYTTEGCCYGNLLWWLFDVTCLRRGNRVASVSGQWRMSACVRLITPVPFSTFMLRWAPSFPCQHSFPASYPSARHGMFLKSYYNKNHKGKKILSIITQKKTYRSLVRAVS